MDSGERLNELFLALFSSDAELRRFLALYGFASPRASQTRESLRSAAYRTARLLLEDGQVNEALFSALAERAPERRPDIRDVARFYGVGAEESRSVPRDTALPDDVAPELAEFAQQLKTDLDALEVVPDDAARAIDPGHWPWTAAAAVLGSFQPTALRPLPGSNPPASALVALADCIFVSSDGSWVLRQEFRVPCLQRLWSHNELSAALEANSGVPDLHRDLIRQLDYGFAPPLAELDTRSLEALGVVVDWLEPVLGPDLPVTSAAVAAAAERRQLLDPLRALAGRHFRGRASELAAIRDHIRLVTPEQVLCLQGPGGIGKSSLMGKVLLDLDDQVSQGPSPVSFAYIDFDRTRHDPHDPIGLLEQMARQLRLQYATAAEADQFAAVESVSAGTDLDYAANILQISWYPDLSGMVNVLADRLRLVRDRYSPGGVSLVLALDTFEEVQVKGPGATHNVLDLVDRLQHALPDMRVIVSGRGIIREFERDASARFIWLEDLDREAADALLEDLGVTDAGLRVQIAEQFGRNPLTLHLAARALAGANTGEEALDTFIAQADALAKVSVELVQGILYRRILGHIADPDVVKVAYPGLAVRRVTVGVLREVLAEPCGFDPDRAEAIFERLQKDVAMFDLEDPDTLRHRPDVRRLMLRIMREDPKQAPVVNQIHQLAAAYYASRGGDEAGAEELYHRLTGGEDPRLLSRLWHPKLNPLLASALEEPLPSRARSWLSRRLGLGPGLDDERDEWDQEDWEGDAASRAASWLASGRPAQCLEVLSERSERLDGSRLYVLGVAAYTALGRLDQAAESLDRGLRSAVSVGDYVAQLELLEAAITLRARQGDGPGVVEAVRSAVALTDVTGEPARALQALTSAVVLLRDRGLDDEVAALNAEISRRFGDFSGSDMREQPELVRRVLHTAGTTDSSVLVHAAVEVADERWDRDTVFVEDSFVLQRLLTQTSSSAKPALAELASEVGLPEEGWSMADLTSRAVRFGRTGQVIALGLDYASNDSAARELVVDNLVRPWPGERL
jgi:hypothetical protein